MQTGISLSDLDWQTCERARLARDAAYDGKFLVGVKTTGIYCRPSCRSRTALAKNVIYLPSIDAAKQAGLRACLRCRPGA
jgi:AraC family transcriptional regulator of adaptative response / DNA-3-methyladenine glycosylase II